MIIFQSSDNTLPSCFLGQLAASLFWAYSHQDKAPSAPLLDGGYQWHMPEADAFGLSVQPDHFLTSPPSFPNQGTTLRPLEALQPYSYATSLLAKKRHKAHTFPSVKGKGHVEEKEGTDLELQCSAEVGGNPG